jgi:hypothetical protein
LCQLPREHFFSGRFRKPAEKKAVTRTFVGEVLNQGQLYRMSDLVALDFVELDPLPGQQQGREGLQQVITAFRTAVS